MDISKKVDEINNFNVQLSNRIWNAFIRKDIKTLQLLSDTLKTISEDIRTIIKDLENHYDDTSKIERLLILYGILHYKDFGEIFEHIRDLKGNDLKIAEIVSAIREKLDIEL